jgi:uncharacterized protein (DUF697 family)
MALGLRPAAVLGLVRELRAVAAAVEPLQISGVLAEQLALELRAGGEARLVRVDGDPASAAVLVVVLGGEAREEDARLLRAASRARTPAIAVQAGREPDVDVPYVLATDVVPCPPGAGFPVEEIARAIAHRLGEEGTALAARLPVLREAVCRELISSFSRRNGVVGAAVFVPGADLPVLTLNQLRLVLRIAAAHGVEIDEQRAPEILATIGSGLAFRALAREALGAVPIAGWALKGGLAYAGTRALGEAALLRFAAESGSVRSRS